MEPTGGWMRHGECSRFGANIGHHTTSVHWIVAHIHTTCVSCTIWVGTVVRQVGQRLVCERAVVWLLHVVVSNTVLEGVATETRLLTNRRAASLDLVGATLHATHATTLCLLTAILGRCAIERLGILGLMSHRADPAGTTILDDRIARTRATFQRCKALLVDVIWKSTEKLLETTGGSHIWPDAQSGSDVDPLNWWEIVHLVRDVLATVQVIDWLTPWRLLCVGVHVLQRCNFVLGLKAPIANTTTELGSHNLDILIVGPVVIWVGHEVGITPSDYRWGGFSGFRGCRHFV